MSGAHDDGAEAVWAAAVAGDGDAFASLFDLHKDRVYRHACRLLDDRTEAEDASATAFLELWRRRNEVRLVQGSVLPWLLVTTSNVARNVRRSSGRYRRLLARLPRDHTAADAAGEVIAIDGFDPQLARQLRELKPVDLALLSLVVLEGYPIADAARVVGLSEGAAKTRLHRSRTRLRLGWTGSASQGAPS